MRCYQEANEDRVGALLWAELPLVGSDEWRSVPLNRRRPGVLRVGIVPNGDIDHCSKNHRLVVNVLPVDGERAAEPVVRASA